MINTIYAKAYTEVLEIIKYFPQNEYIKIPKEKVNFYENNKDKNYIFTINPEIDLSKQNISAEANAILINLYTDYFSTEEQKIEIKKILKTNQEKKEILKREKYNPDNLFQNNPEKTIFVENITIDEDSTDSLLIKYKEPFFIKFKNFIFKILHITNKRY